MLSLIHWTTLFTGFSVQSAISAIGNPLQYILMANSLSLASSMH